MISGSYKILKNGKEVCESKNLLTTFGKDTIIKYLTNSVSTWGDSIAIGTGNTAATVSDSRLGFEFSRNQVGLKSPNIFTSISSGSSGTSGASTVTITLPTTNSSMTSYGGGTVGTVTSQTATITGLSTTSGLVVGGLISATNGTGSLGTGTVITSIVSSTSITVSATSGLTAGTVTAIGSLYVATGMSVSGTGINSNAIVMSISGLTFTLSHTNSGTVSGALTFTSRKVLLKATLDPSLVGTISEVGLYTSQGSSFSNGFDGKILTKFDEGINSSGGTNSSIWSNHATASSSASSSLIGSYNINLTGSPSTTIWLGATSAPTSLPGSLQVDLTGYTRGDTLQLAFSPGASSTGAIVVTLYDDQPTPQTLVWTIPSTSYTVATTTTSSSANQGSYTIVVTSAAGISLGMSVVGTNIGPNAVVTAINSTTITLSSPHVGTVATSTSVTFSPRYIATTTFNGVNVSTSATFNYNVSAIGISSGTANISFDALRVDDTDTLDTSFGLVSRSVLSTPITKALGDSLDIQYELTLGL